MIDATNVDTKAPIPGNNKASQLLSGPFTNKNISKVEIVLAKLSIVAIMPILSMP